MKNAKWGVVVLVVIFGLQFSHSTMALEVTPAFVQQAEGTSATVRLTIESDDWVFVSNVFPETDCAQNGYEYEFRYSYTLQDGTATWGADLSILVAGEDDSAPPPATIIGTAICTNDLSRQSFTLGTVQLLEDTAIESLENASIGFDYNYNCFSEEPVEDHPDGSVPVDPFSCFRFVSQGIQIEDTTPPLPIAGISPVNDAAEPATNGTFEVFLDQPAPEGGLSIGYSTSGTARRGTDYSSGSISFSAGETSTTLAITVIDDQLPEGAEDVAVTLRSGSGYTLSSTADEASIVIEDDDVKSVSIAAAQNGVEGGANGQFMITLSEPAPAGGVTVSYMLNPSASTATEGADFQPLGGSVSIGGGETSASISVIVIDDTVGGEGTETVSVSISISETSGYFVQSPGMATVSITDNDQVGIRVEPVFLTVDEGGRTAAFTVVLTSQPTANVNISLESSDPGEGTIDKSSLAFPPGSWNTPQSVVVTGVADDDEDGDVEFSIVLNPAESADAAYNGLNPQDVTVVNMDEPTGQALFQVDAFSVSEADGVATVSVVRSEGTGGPLTVFVVTDDDNPETTATPGTNYVSTRAQVSWADGQSGEMTASVPIIDSFNPDNLTVVLNLESANGVVLAMARLDIENNFEQDVTDVLVDPSLSPNQQSMARAIATSCSQGAADPDLNAADFQQLCTAMVVAAVTPESKNNLPAAMKEVTPDNAAAVKAPSMETMNVQNSNVGGRMAALRGGASGFSAQGFSLNFAEFAMTGDLVRGFVSNFDKYQPGFSQPVPSQGNSLNAVDDDMDSFGRWGAWVTGRIVFGDKDPTTNQVEYDFNTAGITFGLDYRFTDKFVAGVAAGYADTGTKVDGDSGRLDTRGYSATVYANYFHSEQLYFGGSVSYGRNDYKQDRRVEYTLVPANPGGGLPFNVSQQFDADYNGNQMGFTLEGGYDFNKGGWTFGPTFGLDYVEVDIDGYDERLLSSNVPGTLGWGVHIDDQNFKSLQPSIGFNFSKAISRGWGVLIPQGRIDFVSELEDEGALVSGRFLGDGTMTPFSLETDSFDESFFRVGLGFGLILKNNKSAFLMVDGDLNRALLETYYVNAGFRWQF